MGQMETHQIATQGAGAGQQSGGFLEVAKSRAAQEIQAAMVIAKRSPRNTIDARNRILQDCQRKSLAQKAVYAYPKGKGNMVTGPSIRLAETLAKNWGNIDFGTVELERTPGIGKEPGESTMMAYAWDLETNTRQTKVFTVRHKRDTKNGSYNLDDDREVYELTANQGARRLRACLLGIIPGDIVEDAVKQCEKTMAGGEGPLVDRIREMAKVFQDEFQVTVQMLEKYLKHKLEATSEPELVRMGQIYRALDDGMASREDYFEIDATQAGKAPELNAAVAAAAPTAPQPAQPPTPAQAAPAAPAPVKPPKEKKVTKPAAPSIPSAQAGGSPVPAAPVAPAQTAVGTPPPVEDDVPDFASSPTHVHAPEPTPPAKPAQPAVAPAQPQPQAAAPAAPEYRIDFGSHGPQNGQPGKRPQDFGLDGAKAYIEQIKAHVAKKPELINDPKLNRAIVELQRFIDASEGPGL
jgi:hypothetical protein